VCFAALNVQRVLSLSTHTGCCVVEVTDNRFRGNLLSISPDVTGRYIRASDEVTRRISTKFCYERIMNVIFKQLYSNIWNKRTDCVNRTLKYIHTYVCCVYMVIVK